VKLLITGAKGQLGSELQVLSTERKNDEFTFVDIEEMDLGTDRAIENYFEGRHFDFVVNCAAYTAVDKAEDDQVLAFRVNAGAVKAIADICKRKSMRLIHISTDYVFDGNGNLPIGEDTTPHPLSVYGQSKLDGERYVKETLDNAYVIRTAWVYSSYGKNFIKTISKLARERASLSVVNDQFGSPTYARDLASVILQMIDKISTGVVDIPGTYHYSNEGAISWFDLAWFIVHHERLSCQVLPIPSEDYPTRAVRPRFSVLDKRKLKHTFGIEIPHWYTSLEDCLNQLKQ
jgi:dTDP-4-dehydrorhamnose reductase